MINEKSSIAKPVLIFVILLVIIMALGAIVYLTMFKNPSPIAVQPTASPKTTTMPDIDIADWQIYRNEKYRFEFEYPDTLFLTKQEKGTSILSSFSTTDIEASSVSDLAISIENIKISSYEDAQNYIKNLPIYLEGAGPYEKNLGGTLVYINTIKLYGGGEGVSKKYYFPKFVLVFAYANNNAENKFKDIEDKILFTFKFTEKDETDENYKLDCTDKPDSFQSKYSWYGHFKEQIIKNWSLDIVCYNGELNKAVYLKSKLDLENYVYDPKRTSYGFSQLGIYDIEKDIYDKAPEKNLGFYEGCGIIKEWNKNNEIIYQCGAGDAGVGTTSTFFYNIITKTINLIEECNIQAGREPEEICAKK